MRQIDNGTLKNSDIRKRIRELTKIDKENISFGQAKKVINVTIKQYCFIANANDELLKELDCPLDTTTMRGYKIKHKRMIDVNEEDYLAYQDHFDKEFDGMRILKDRKYDEMRIDSFF